MESDDDENPGPLICYLYSQPIATESTQGTQELVDELTYKTESREIQKVLEESGQAVSYLE